jgi:hypothetical protein
MLMFVTLAALSIAVIVFLNFLNLPSGKQAADTPASPQRLDAAKVLRMPAQNRPRICPVCGTLLGPEDYLMASIFPDPGPDRKRQAHIYGCVHCFATEGVNLRLKKMDPELLEGQNARAS